MTEERVNRRLAAILAADVVGYSKLMGQDEAGTRARFNAHLKELIEPSIAQRQGRLVKTLGDGLLVEFASVIDAVQFAIQVQNSMRDRNSNEPEDRRIVFRIGINLGDIIVEGEDIHGDGVNVAARLEGLANAGEICVARNVRDQIRDKLNLDLVDMGEVKVKNVARPIRAFQITMNEKSAVLGSGANTPSKPVGRIGWPSVITVAAVFLLLLGAFGLYRWQTEGPASQSASEDQMKFALPSKPSIAVLPFENISDDPAQDVFSDGITEDIITDLSKISGIFVTARHATIDYKDSPATTYQVAEDLGVRYVLSGGVRWAEDKVRITAQLADAIRNENLWSERYDRDSSDVFAVQSDVTRNVVKAMEVTLKAREHDRVFQKYFKNIDAYNVWRQARATVEVPSRQNIEDGQMLFERAIDLDPDFAGGYAGLSFNHSVMARFGYSEDPARDVARAFELAEKAIELDPEFAWSHIALAGALLANSEYDAAVDAMRRALAIQPGDYETNLFMGFYLFRSGRAEQAIEHLKIADNLGRVPTYRLLAFLGISYFMNEQYAECEATWNRAADRFGLIKHPAYYVYLASCQVALDDPEGAVETVAKFQRVFPDFRLSQSGSLRNFKSAEFKRRLRDLAFSAGIPD